MKGVNASDHESVFGSELTDAVAIIAVSRFVPLHLPTDRQIEHCTDNQERDEQSPRNCEQICHHVVTPRPGHLKQSDRLSWWV